MITLITIGQTPREDLMKAFNLGGVMDAQLIGALDKVSLDEISMLEKLPGEEKLYVVLKSGMANINHEIIEQKVEKLITEYAASSEAIALLCMSEFKCTSNQTKVVYPIKEMKEKVRDITHNDTTIIFVPIKEQLESAKIKWDSVEGKKHFVAVHPKSESVLDEISRKINLYNSNHVILDCYGYEFELVDEIEKKHQCACYNAQESVVKKIKDVINEYK
ncbi:AroM family protein [Peribacillus simplex]|uniref:AroM family protein n=1 Tax=Peribacillus simplex TaxID=1478 RepID=UPI003395DA61